MKTSIIGLALLLLVGLFASSCATMDRLNTEYEEETARTEKMSPQQQHDDFMTDMRGYFGDGD